MTLSERDLASLPRIHGGRSTLIHLWQDAGGKRVVVKTLRHDQVSPRQRQRLLNEYELTRGLRIPGVRAVLDRIDLDGRPALLMEYVEGATLGQALGDGRGSLAEILAVALSISRILDGLHRSGIIHRNISATNILVDPVRRTATIIDFGMAIRNDPGGGAPPCPEPEDVALPYASPELTGRINHPVDQRSDLYSLGALLYEMLTGRPPFEADSIPELIHCHIARAPRPAGELRPDLPLVLADMLNKLLAKNPEERYQSAHGLTKDLERCLHQLEERGEVGSFEPGRDDVSALFRIPARLYGRERELGELQEALAGLAGGRGGTLLVSGAEGVGKSALVNELRRPVGAGGGYFIAGRYDAQRRNIPYHGLIEACDRLVDLMLTESGEQLARRRGAILTALGESRERLTDVLPRLELVIGAPLAPRAEGDGEPQGNFQCLFQRFIDAVSQREHPLVLFLDNLQWADDATLQLLRLLAAGAEERCLLLICACREGDGSADHDREEVLEYLRRAPGTIGMLHLENLSRQALESLVADALACGADHARSLAELVHDKSGGNPLFAVRLLQSLHAGGLLGFDGQLGRWTWDVERIRGVAVTDNLVSLMMELIAGLPAGTRELLSLAACIGASFGLEQLAALAGGSAERAADALRPAVAQRLVLPLAEAQPVRGETWSGSHRFVFSHERVRQLAYSRLSRKRRRTAHLAMGRLLLAELGEGEPGEAVFTIADHLNEAFPHLESAAERLSLARLNLNAGRRARRMAASGAAIWYLNMGMGLLPPDKWRSSHDLTLDLYLEAVEAECQSGNFGRAELLAGEAVRQARELPARIRLYESLILLYTAQSRDAAAIRVGLAALSRLNVYLPVAAEDITAYVEGGRARLPAEPEQIDALAHLPLLDDPRMLAARRILMHLTVPAHRSHSPLLPAIVLSVLLMSLKRGNSPTSALAYAWYGALQCGTCTHIGQGYRFGQLALNLLKSFRVAEPDGGAEVLFNTLVRPWKEHALVSARALGDLSRRGVASGDLVYSHDAAVHHCGYLFCCGASLEQVRLEQERCLESAELLRLEFHGGFVRIWGQMVLNLVGRSPDPGCLSGELLDESGMLPLWMERNEPQLVYSLLCCRTMLGYLFGRHADAIDSARLAEACEGGEEAYLYRAELHFYHALALLAGCPGVDAATREDYLGRVAAIQRRMECWAEHAPMNFGHKRDLIRAELARVTGDTAGAMESYGRAIGGAARHGYLHEEALSREREAELYLALGREDLAAFDMGKAVELYRQWGAEAKVAQLEERHGGLLVREKPLSLDCAAIMTASRALSREVRIEQLLDRMMRIVMENAGAEKGILVENRDGRLIVQARGGVGPARVETMQELPIETSGELPLAVANYVARTQTPLVLNDAVRDATFADDPYIVAHNTRSLLCLPIVHQGRLSGLLYLENNLTTSVFTPDRLELLKALSSQAAISMRNAALYADLEKTVGEIRRTELFLQQMLDTMPIPVFFKDKSGVYLGCNAMFERSFGLSRSQVVGKTVYDLAPRELADVYHRADAELLGHPGVQVYEASVQFGDGTRHDVIFHKATYMDAGGGVAGIVGAILDITERKRAEALVRASLVEKEILLKEVHHRVKNNLQIISTLLDLQSDHIDEHSREVLRESQSRIRSIALVHEKLYQTKDFSAIDFQDYLESLGDDLLHSYVTDRERITLDIDAAGVSLGMDAAVPCGLIICELLTNALKYAFPNGREGNIRVRFRSGADRSLVLTVADDGVGLPADLDFRQAETLGLQLVTMLAKQLRGTVQQVQQPGTAFSIRFWDNSAA